MAGCASCRAWISALARASWLEASAKAEPDMPSETPGERYVPLVELGRGAMGTVWAAYDAQLDREVALKVLDGGSAERLRAEARALASVSHPNVVEVFDVSPPAIAMALVEGPTLQAWLVLARRSSAEVVAAFEQAGRGLAAVHAAGLVHRDFKPSNAIVGADGRILVVDFGLAEDHVEGASTGFAGTRAFMAPERLRGDPATPASDQYAWCVALREALRDSSDRVPRRIAHVVSRGLEPEPEARWPSMEALLSALARPTRRRWGTVPLAALGVAAVFGALRSAPEPCQTSGALGPSLWLRTRAAASSTDRVLADRAQAWVRADRAHCEARPRLAPTAVRERQRCLDRTRQHLQAAAEALAHADALRAGAVVTHLPEPGSCMEASPSEPLSTTEVLLDDAVVQLEVLARAGALDEARHRADALRPTIERDAGPVLRSRFDFALSTVQVLAGEDGSAMLQHAARAGTTGGDRSVAARAAMRLASFSSPKVPLDPETSRTWLARAESLVEALDSDPLRRELARARGNAAHYFGRYDEAAVELRHAVQLGEGGDSLILAEDLDALADTLCLAGKLDEAASIQRRALDLLERGLGEGHPITARALETLGKIRMAQGRFDEARDAYATSLARREAVLGPEHIDIAVVATNLASAHISLGDPGKAVPLLRRVTALEHDELEPGRATASTWHVLGNAYVMQDALADADAAFSTGLEHVDHEVEPDHPERAIYLSSLASVALDRRQPDRAVRLATRSRALRAAAYGEDDPRLAFEDLVLAGAHLEQGRPDLALTVATRGEALLSEHPVRPRWLAELRFFRARAHAAMGARELGLQEAELAAALFESLGDADVGAEIRAWADQG